ncbi:hypothetical protein G5V58_00945 [Nocardioides anomalus]|uniref:Neutral metalloprotease n=1 Tax=Nocardioides anomalus TaxID=2712223 RepID=A0A6G6W8H2_9ACTN|nr:MXAN_6640 family putative metalloprotease [Nocardioides anomalus]QIG41524.1 hypothetical protein G5V58_00945 [Nocardioides anomalus]
MPTTSRARRNPALVLTAAVAAAFALVATTLSTPALAAPSAARTASVAKPAVKHDRTWRAKAALAQAQKAFSPSTPANQRPDATLALRKLWMLKDALSPADRAAADRLAQRPDKPATVGDENILLHYDPAELNPAAFDQNVALATVQNVANTYAASGYRRPKPDKGKGGDNRIDIYLDSLEPGLYGYCTTDQRLRGRHHDVWAYCVLDNDYAGFPSHTPLQNLQVTAAHEYFHATQFAYDALDDDWLLEATATWAEDELYDDVNDNVQYLRRSPITSPGRSMDKFEDTGVFQYGVWNFFRLMSNTYPEKTGLLPNVILKIWEAADSSKGRKNLYSTQAINKVLKKNGTSLADFFTYYSAATRLTHTPIFDEGVEQNYPIKPAAGSVTLAGGKGAKGKLNLDHLTSATLNIANGGGASALKVKLRMAPKSHGSKAIYVAYGANGAVLSIQAIKVNRKGKGKATVAFDPSVTSVDVTLVNASTKYRQCGRYQRNAVSCSGKAVFDNQRSRVSVKAA